jgi:hypothetical protein
VCVTVVTQLCFQIVEEINYRFRPFSGWAIIRLKLEYLRNLTLQYGLYMKNGGTKSRFIVVGEVLSYIYVMWNLRQLDLICHVICTLVDMWAGVVFGSCFIGGIRKPPQPL